MTPHVLIVEDDRNALLALEAIVGEEGYSTATAATLAEAKAAIERQAPDLILADLNLPDGRGTDLLNDDENDHDLVLITGQASLETAVEAIRLGVMDYLTKPVDLRRLGSLLTNFRRTSALRQEVSHLREELRDAGRFGLLVGASPTMQKVFSMIERVARTDATVLVTGESGTGKELVSRSVHEVSPRRQSTWIPVNCGAISANLIESELFGHERGAFTGAERRHIGHFEQADGGTLFLDEVTEMPLELQVKLLRALENGEIRRVGGRDTIKVDVRVIAASNRDPRQAVDEGKLREDLFYRLRVFPIDVPPLRDRGDDIELLARHFLADLNRKYESQKKISDAAIERLAGYSWPGNVRELKNAVQRAYIMAEDRIDEACLPREVRLDLEEPTSGPYLKVKIGSKIEDMEKRLILATLDDNDGKKNETADALGISLKTLYNRLKSYGL